MTEEIADTLMWIPDSLQPLYSISPWLPLVLMITLLGLGVWLLLHSQRPRMRLNGALLLLLATLLLLCMVWPTGMQHVVLLVGLPWPWW